MIEINLLPEELKTKAKRASAAENRFLYSIPLLLAVLICVHIYLAMLILTKSYKLHVLNNTWDGLGPQRKALEDFHKKYDVVASDAKAIQQLAEQKINWSEKLNKLSLILPPGVWFNELIISARDFVLRGSVVSLQKEEMSLIKQFIDGLKKDNNFFKDFVSLELSSVQRRTIGGYDILDFNLDGSLK